MSKSVTDYLIFDITNILYRTFFAHKTEDDITVAGLASHTALVTLNKYYRQFSPRKIVMCFDRTSWRKEYTKSDLCLSGKVYKGNRRQKMSPKDKERYELFLQHLNDFEVMLRDHTSIITLAGQGLEADDLIAGVVQTMSVTEENSSFVIVSSDKDMIQVLRYPKVRLINPADGKDRTLDEWDGDADLFMFEKCIRGDAGDNVQSALPRCRKTRIKKAYTDPYEYANLMMEAWSNQDGKEFVVKHLYEENKLLMDLTCQPEEIQQTIVKTILEGFKSPGTFSYFHFMKFLGKYELKKIAEQAETFVPMLGK